MVLLPPLLTTVDLVVVGTEWRATSSGGCGALRVVNDMTMVIEEDIVLLPINNFVIKIIPSLFGHQHHGRVLEAS